MSRAFTYNNGNYISGSEQIGNLAIGLTAQNYASNPGGKTWWGGPDESNRYVVAKDVSSENWSTPLGNIGNVKFWGCAETDNAFIDLVNKIGSNQFVTISDCLDWLSNNGYWSNYPSIYSTPAPRQNKTSFRIQPLPTFSRIATAGGPMTYNNANSEMYVGLSYWEDSYTTYAPAYLDVDTVATTATINISSSSPENQGYFTSSATLQEIPGSGFIWFDGSDYLYSIGCVEVSPNGEKSRISKYDVTDKEVKAYSSKIDTPELYTYTVITGLSNLGLVYVAYYSGSPAPSIPDVYIESYYTSSLTKKDTYKIPSNNNVVGLYGIVANPTNNTIFFTGGGNDGKRTILLDGTDLSLIRTNDYTNIPRTGNVTYDGPIYVESVNRFYFRTGRSNEPSGPLQKTDGLLYAINADNTTNKRIDLGGGDGSNVQMNIGGIAYDPKRKVIWTATRNMNNTSNLDTWFFQAIDPVSNELVKTCPQPSGLITSGGEGISPHHFAIDTKNDKLYVSDYVNNPYTEGNLMVWDLNDLWPT